MGIVPYAPMLNRVRTVGRERDELRDLFERHAFMNPRNYSYSLVIGDWLLYSSLVIRIDRLAVNGVT